MLERLARVVRKGDERLDYWTSYAFRLEHELGEAVHRARCPECGEVVGAGGIEPPASAMSKQRSTADLRARRDKTVTKKSRKGRKINRMMATTATMSRSKGQAKRRKNKGE